MNDIFHQQVALKLMRANDLMAQAGLKEIAIMKMLTEKDPKVSRRRKTRRGSGGIERQFMPMEVKLCTTSRVVLPIRFPN